MTLSLGLGEAEHRAVNSCACMLFPAGLRTAHVLRRREELGYLEPQMGCTYGAAW